MPLTIPSRICLELSNTNKKDSGNQQTSSDERLLDAWLFDQKNTTFSFGWIQYCGPLEGDTLPNKGPWIGVAWDHTSPSYRGAHRRTAVWNGKLLFESVTDRVSFLRLHALPFWTYTGFSFLQAISHRYMYQAQDTPHFKLRATASLPLTTSIDSTPSSYPPVILVGLVPGRPYLSLQQTLNLSHISIANGLLTSAYTHFHPQHDVDLPVVVEEEARKRSIDVTESESGSWSTGRQSSCPACQLQNGLSEGGIRHCEEWSELESAVITQGAVFTSVKSLDLSGSMMLCHWKRLAEMLAITPNLQEVNLSGCSQLVCDLSSGIGDKFVMEDEFEFSEKIESVNLSNLARSDKDNFRVFSVSVLAKFIRRFPGLKRLSLANNGLSVADWKVMFGEEEQREDRSMKAVGLEHLDLAENLFDDVCLLLLELRGGVWSKTLKEVDLCRNPFSWRDNNGLMESLLAQPCSVESLKLDECNLGSWNDFYFVARIFPHLKSLRIWRNPIFDLSPKQEVPDDAGGDQRRQVLSELDRRRYLRWSLCPELKRCDGEEIDNTKRVEAERYVKSLLSNRKHVNTYFGTPLNPLVVPLLQALLRRLGEEDDTLALRLTGEGSEGEDFQCWKDLKRLYPFLKRPPSFLREITELPHHIEVQVQINDRGYTQTFRVMPTYTTAERLKHLIALRLGDFVVMNKTLVLEKRAIIDQEEEIKCPCRSIKHSQKQDKKGIVCEPDYNTLTYFGVDSSTNSLRLLSIDRVEFSYRANYERRLELSTGHGVLRKLRS